MCPYLAQTPLDLVGTVLNARENMLCQIGLKSGNMHTRKKAAHIVSTVLQLYQVRELPERLLPP